MRIEVRAEMVGNVWQVFKAAGDVVLAGDTIAILESMKMEIPVEAPADATITELRVTPGDAVDADDLLAVLETAH